MSIYQVMCYHAIRSEAIYNYNYKRSSVKVHICKFYRLPLRCICFPVCKSSITIIHPFVYAKNPKNYMNKKAKLNAINNIRRLIMKK